MASVTWQPRKAEAVPGSAIYTLRNVTLHWKV